MIKKNNPYTTELINFLNAYVQSVIAKQLNRSTTSNVTTSADRSTEFHSRTVYPRTDPTRSTLGGLPRTRVAVRASFLSAARRFSIKARRG